MLSGKKGIHELWWRAVSVFVGEGKDGLADMTHFGPTMYLWGECLLYVGSFHEGLDNQCGIRNFISRDSPNCHSCVGILNSSAYLSICLYVKAQAVRKIIQGCEQIVPAKVILICMHVSDLTRACVVCTHIL